MNIRLATYYHAKDVPALPGSNIFHSTELFHVLEQTRGVRPLLLAAPPICYVLLKRVMRTAQVNTFLPPIRKNIFFRNCFPTLRSSLQRNLFF